MNVAIVQARMTSQRFPGKVLAEIDGKPMLRHVIDRVRDAERVDRVIVAAPKTGGGDVIRARCAMWDAECMVTPHAEDDVLARVLAVAEKAGATRVVRVCSDNPLINPSGIDALLAAAEESGADYTGYQAADGRPMIQVPSGWFAEVVSMGALRRLHRSTRIAPSPTREHVTLGFYSDLARYTCRWLPLPAWYVENDLPDTAIDRPEEIANLEEWLAEFDDKENRPWK